ncbi:MAG: HD domain-containing protein [Candidatus Coprovivens sp.]
MLEYYKEKLGEIPEFMLKYLKVPCLLRLKNIGYFCGMDYASKEIYNFSEIITRYDHSLTVAMITWKYTHNKKATLAGLFHDIATPCFSHVIDYMNKDYENQESTEEYTDLIMKSDRALIDALEEDNIDIEDIIYFKRYSIVDNDRPKLCADRLDGLILTGIGWTKSVNKNIIDAIMDDVIVCNDEDGNQELGFKNKDIAELALKISEEIDCFCHSREDNYMMELLANITNLAIINGIINYNDLYVMNEKEVIKRLKNNNILEIKLLMHMFENMRIQDIDSVELPNVKIRDLNPLVINLRLKK